MLRVQERRWRSLMRFALATSPFYRRHLSGLDPDRCAYTDIPPITKSQLTANWDEIVPDPRLRMDRLRAFLSDRRNWGTLYCGRWMVSESSGTMGSPATLPQDVVALDWMHAVHSVRNGPLPDKASLPPWHPFKRRLRLASFICTRAPFSSAAIFKTRPWVSSLFHTHHPIPIDTPWHEVIERLNRIQPDVLLLYASMLERLAHAQLEGSLQLKFSHPAATISTGGDALSPGIRALCKQAFGIEPLDTYGATECPIIARQWHGVDRMLLMEDLAVFEAVDRSGHPAAENELSDHVMVTPLNNRAVPLLRFRLDDCVRVGPVQPGWPFRRIEEMVGRTSMIFEFRVPEQRVAVGMNLMGRWYNHPQLTAYQLKQVSKQDIQCAFIAQPGQDAQGIAASIAAEMRAALDTAGCRAVQCRAVAVTSLEKHPRSGKTERYIPLYEDYTV